MIREIKNTKQKGRKLVIQSLQTIHQYFSDAYEVNGSGSGLEKGDIRIPSVDLVIEAKNHKKINIGNWVRQSEREGLGYNKTALLWKTPDSPQDDPAIRIDIDIRYFLDLLKRSQEPKIKVQDRELSYEIRRLIQSAKQVIKKLEK